MLDITINSEQKVKVTLKPVTANGKPAKLDGAPSWSVLSGPGTLVEDADHMAAYLVSDDSDLTDTVYQVDADADLGSGVDNLSDKITLHVTGMNAKNLGLAAGTPENK